MTRFSKKSSTLSLTSNLSVLSTSKSYNALDHFETCIYITKNLNSPIPESYKNFYESYIKYISFKKYPQIDKRFDLDIVKRPLIISCWDVTKYMTELALPEKINKLKYNYNWSMERWKIMYKKRITIERFKNSIEKVIENLKTKKPIVSIKCDPWIHFMPDPYLDSTVYSTKYCLKKVKEKNYSYFVCDEEYLNEDKYNYFYLNGFKETLEDSEEEDIELPSSFNNNYHYKDGLIRVEKKKKSYAKKFSSAKLNISNNNSHKTEFIYFVKKIIMERKRTNPSGDPWDAFFYIHMEPDKKNLTFKVNIKELKVEKHSSSTVVQCLDENITDNDNEIISPLCSTSLSPKSSDYDNQILSDVSEIENVNDTELIEKNKEDFEKLNLNDKECNQLDKNDNFIANEDIINSPKYSNESMGLSRKINSVNNLPPQFFKINNIIKHNDDNISEKEEIIIQPISKDNIIKSCDHETNTLPLIYKKTQMYTRKYKNVYGEKKKTFPIISKKQIIQPLNWKVSTIVRYSPDGKTHSNRSFYLPRIVCSNLQQLPKTSVNVPFSSNLSSLPQLSSTSRPPSSLKNNFISSSRQNLSSKLF